MDTYDNWDGERQRFFKKLKKYIKNNAVFYQKGTFTNWGGET